MIIGLLLGISIAMSLTSFWMIIMGTTGVIRENLVTGAIIGTEGIVSYAIIVLIFSLIATFFLALILKKPKKN